MIVIVDFSRYTWVLFLSSKNKTLNLFTPFCKIIQNEKKFSISIIRSDHEKEFENLGFNEFCGENGISHNEALNLFTPF